MSLAVGVGLLTAVAGFAGCSQSSDSSGAGNTPSQNSTPSGADTNAAPSAGMNTNSPATTGTNAP
ncbi:MAG TPA: hypothetical protein VK811_06565 [Candidatus Acidoferrum sp.]|nr:hypothetical protein [Candidatus Acidoferrum sp.]